MSQTNAQKLLDKFKTRPREIVEVEPEAGYIYRFYQPNTVGIVLSGELTTAMADEAETEWQKDGVGLALTDNQKERLAAAGEVNRAELQAQFESENLAEAEARQTTAGAERAAARSAEIAETRTCRLIEHSYSPKLVKGRANETKDEISIDQLPPEHLTYLFTWIGAGGSELLRVQMFPQVSRAGSGTGDFSKKLRKTRQQFGKTR